MKKIIIVLSCMFAFYTSKTQSVGVNNTGATPNPSAMLDVQSTTKGMLVPRMNTTMRTGISSPATGLLVFDTQTGSFWYYTGTNWQNLSVGTELTDADNDTKIEVEKSMDEDTIRITSNGHEIALFDNKTFHLGAADGSVFIGKNSGKGDDGTNNNSTAVGYNTLKNDTTGWNNTAVGFEALSQSDAGDNNTAVGANAMKATKYGDFNVAVGSSALLNSSAGAGNVALGHQSMYSTTGAQRNVAIGHKSMFSNTNAERTIAIGNRSLYHNDNIDGIIAIGDSALFHNSIGAFKVYHSLDNTAIGDKALKENNLGNRNTAIGARSMMNNITGYENLAVGVDALSLNTFGYENVAIGNESQSQNANGNRNISVGHSTLRVNAGSSNVALGHSSLSGNDSGSSNIGIGTFSLRQNDDGDNNIAFGSYALYKNNSGSNNISIGGSSLYNSTADNNIGIGKSSAHKNTTGSHNIAVGTGALYNNTTISGIVAIGDSALYNNGLGASGTDATLNTAVGYKALQKNEQGKQNTALGYNALTDNDYANYNTAIGSEALQSNVTGNTNTAVGAATLTKHTGGAGNLALGYASLNDHLSGANNTAVGTYTLLNSIDGANNVALGYYADGNNENGTNNTIIGYQAGKNNSTHSKSGNIFLGYQAGYSETSDNKLYIENSSSATPLIYGDFDTDLLRVNGDLQIGTSYTFPSSDGSNGKVIQTDGSGNLSWGNGSLWTESSPNIYFNTGSVAIGNTIANHRLSVIDTSSVLDGTDGVFIDVQNSNSSISVMNGIRFRNGTTANTFKGGIYYRDMAGYGRGDMLFVNDNNNDQTNVTADDARMIIPHGDNIEFYNVENSNENLLQINNDGPIGLSTSGIFMSAGVTNTIGHIIQQDSAEFEISYKVGTINYDRLSIDASGVMRVGGGDKFIFNPNVAGDSRFTTDEIEIRGGSDLAENFDITVSDLVPIPGMVVSIDPDEIGKLMITSEVKDKKVAGILSGANGIETGMYMGQKGSIADGAYPIALTGRVYVFANEEGGKISPGDFLTSAKQKGYACKVDSPNGAEGAIIGKAMSGIDENGFVLVLVNLQ